jgi:hypothetical protein
LTVELIEEIPLTLSLSPQGEGSRRKAAAGEGNG